jgi:hypothetical protein
MESVVVLLQEHSFKRGHITPPSHDRVQHGLQAAHVLNSARVPQPGRRKQPVAAARGSLPGSRVCDDI